MRHFAKQWGYKDQENIVLKGALTGKTDINTTIIQCDHFSRQMLWVLLENFKSISSSDRKGEHIEKKKKEKKNQYDQKHKSSRWF